MTTGAARPVLVRVPDPSLVVLVGVSGCGKTSFARRHFARTEVVSSDECRALVADDEADQGASRDAFALLHFIAATRLGRRRTTVVDATNVSARARRPLLAIARARRVPASAIVFDLPGEVCLARNAARSARVVEEAVVRQQLETLRGSLPSLVREGFREVVVLRTPDEVDAVSIVRM